MAQKTEKAPAKGTHGDHRKRMREKFYDNGMKSFPDHELVEMLLFHANARGNTNPQAHFLLDEFHDLRGVFDAPYESLLEIEGIGDSAAFLLKLCSELFIRMDSQKKDWFGKVNRVFTGKDAIDLFAYEYSHLGHDRRDEEVVMMACLDNKGRVIRVEKFPPGQVNASSLDVRAIVSKALGRNASMIILAHNHPHGDPMPSKKDVSATNTLKTVLHAMKIHLFDHVVIGEDYEGLSMRDAGLLGTFGSGRD